MKTFTFALSIVAALGLSACSTPAPAPAPSISASAPFDANTNYEGSSSSSGVGEIPTPKKSEAGEDLEPYRIRIIDGNPVSEMPDLPAPTKFKSSVLRPGTGEVIDIETRMVVRDTTYDWETGNDTDTSYPNAARVTKNVSKEVIDAFVGQRVGALIVFEFPADGDRKAYVWVAEVVGTDSPTPKKAEAPKKKKAEERQTYLVQIINGKPFVEMPDLPAPTQMKSIVLRPGSGEEITLDSSMLLHESAYDWETGELTDSTYPQDSNKGVRQYEAGHWGFDGVSKKTSDIFVGQRVGALILVEFPAYGDRNAYIWVAEIVGTEDREPVKTTAKTAGKALSEPSPVAKVEGDVTPQVEKTTPLLKAEKTSATLVGETDAEPSPVTTVPNEPEAPVNGSLPAPRITMGTTYGSIIFDAERSGPVFVSWSGATTDQEAFTVVCPPELRGANFLGCVQSDGSKWQWMPAADVTTWALQTFGGNRV